MPSIKDHKPVPAGVKILSVDSIAVDAADQGLTAQVSIDLNGLSLEYQFGASLQHDKTLADAVTRVTDIILKRLRKPMTVRRKYKCDSCVGTCCIAPTLVAVMEDDIPGLLRATGYKRRSDLWTKGVIVGSGSMGVVGWLSRTKMEHDDAPEAQHCTFLSWDKQGVGRCGIYEERPLTCRQYDERSCSEQRPPIPALHQIRIGASDREPYDVARYVRDNPEYNGGD